MAAPSDNNAAILRQIEYYFSDDSFPKDEYLSKLSSEEGKDGFVDISILAGFGKMKTFLAEAGDDHVKVIADILESSDSLQMNESKQGVKRLYPVPSEDPAANRTIYGGQFLSDESRAGLSELFSKYGKVESVRFLRNLASDDRPYDGGVYVTFEDEASVTAAKLAASKAEIIGTGGPAVLQTMLEYYSDFEKKREGMRKKREGGGGGGGEGNGNKKRKIEIPVFDENYPKGIVAEIKGLGEGDFNIL